MKTQVNFDSLGGGVTLNPTTAWKDPTNDHNMKNTDFPITLTIGKTYSASYLADDSYTNTMDGGDIVYQEVGTYTDVGRVIYSHVIIFTATATTAKITGSGRVFCTILTQLD